MELLNVLVLLVVAAGAACQVLSGVGFALVCTPFLVLTVGHDQGVRTVLAMSILLNIVILLRSFRQVRLGDAFRLLLPAAVLVVPAITLANTVRTPFLSALAGAVILLATALIVAGRALPWLEGTRGAVIAGATSGVFNVLAAASGPPVALFAAQRRWPPIVATATLQAFALPLNVVTLALLRPISSDAAGLGWALTGLVLGTVIASFFSTRVPPRAVRSVTLSIAGLGGATLLITGLMTIA
ncbi:sulfite exporter TauE/SafE family protein [Rathayibacter sp. PhB185]|uniref:sulfite exporter TauE/SafE family protein n=1 Tax=Rathayibacter sp. PhB185 TaxID=2485198 RepID=UPI000F91967D|nr:sulfite exporter TauE/SafE family protein [Rathayibacter sp. PhB185]ROP50146.1 hypothetical protein EDF45_1555 [Rathayibacter sp. PhB186]ROS53104.1 hypothetical protein EDF44_1555 [Rathayibacter sp. PhB185]TCL83618.1 hypothetical protein EDF49_10347 [Rathayibacter sp. PhB192]TCM29211.1 hypothetical protein EDF43_10347 [Rathayibacter sp. PhB179]